MTEAPYLSDDLLEAEFLRRLAEKKKKRIERLGKEAILWLALVPYWTVPLAKFCGYPVNNLDEFIEQAQAAGLCDTGVERGPQGEEITTFWMPSALVSEQISDAKNETGVSAIRDKIIEIAARLRKASEARSRGQELSPSVRRWIELAGRYQGGEGSAARFLTETTQNLISQGKTGDALAWTGTGYLLAQTLGGDMETAILTATSQIELEYRRLQDQRYLEGFLRIDDQFEAFEKLLSAHGDEPWALHYIGMGGVGKTMLIRSLSYQYLDRVATARVDFDYLSPEFPVRKPGILLTHFATELKLNFTSRRELSSFDDLYRLVETLHADLQEGMFAGNWRATLDSPMFQEIIGKFCSILELMISRLGKTPVLILDTCEELVKLQPSNGELPNLEATFAILQRLHDLVPALRVVFAGRRPLALSGSGWSVNQNLHSYLPPEKEYLRLHLLRGFTFDQARTYLYENKNLPLTPEMEASVLEKSIETGDPGDINLPPAPLVKRYNPFDLSLYAGWIKEDPKLTPDMIRNGGADPYIKLRIIERIRNEDLCRLLPAVALLGSFTAEMLRPLLHLNDAAYQDVFWQLSEQEWINPVRSEYGRQNEVIQVESNLLPRLQRFFTGSDWRNLNIETRHLLGPHLDRLVHQHSLSDLSPVQVGPALSLQEPEQAARLWEYIDTAIAKDANWNWGLNVAGQLMGIEDPTNNLRHPIFVALKTTQISAQLHLDGEYDASTDWEVVESALSTYPVIAAQSRYQFLALAGKISSTRWRDRPMPEEWIKSFLQLLDDTLPGVGDPAAQDDQLVAGLVSGVDGLLDWIEARGKEHPVTIENLFKTGWQDRFSQWAFQATPLPDEIRAFAMLQAGRALQIAGQIDRAMEAFQAAENLAKSLGEEANRQIWSFWRTPPFLVDRVRLEWLRQRGYDLIARGSQFLNQWLVEALPRRSSIDADRLISALLQILPEDHRKIANQLIEQVDESPPYHQELRPECWAHRIIPPLWAGHALCLLRAGLDEKASGLMEQCIQQARESTDPFGELAGNRALLKVVRRDRRYRRGETGLVRLLGSSEIADIQAAWPAQVLAMPGSPSAIPQPKPGDSLERKFTWWSCQVAEGQDQAAQVAQKMMDLLQNAGEGAGLSSADRILLALMDYEAKHLPKIWIWPYRETSPQTDYQALVGELSRNIGSLPPFEASGFAGILLRVAAQNPAHSVKDPMEQEITDLLNELEKLSETKSPLFLASSNFLQVDHLAAAQALETGELLSLSHPVAGARLLDFAVRRYESSGDKLAAWTAGVLAILVYLQLGLNDLAQKMLDEHVRPNYQPRADGGNPLPDWNALAALVDTVDKAGLDVLDSSIYPGILHRLLAEIAVLRTLQVAAQGEAEKAAQASAQTTALFSLLAERYNGALPAELALMVAEVEQVLDRLRVEQVEPTLLPTGAQKSPAVPQNAPAQRQPNTLLIGIIAGVILLAIVIVLLVLGYQWVAKMTTQVLLKPLGTLPQLGIFAGLLLLIYLVPASIIQLFRLIRSEIAAESLVAGAVQEAENQIQSDFLRTTLWINLQRSHLQIGWPLLQYGQLISTSSQTVTKRFDSYSAAIGTYLDAIEETLSSLKSALGGRKILPAPLLVDPSLAAEPWESLLQFKLHSRNGNRISFPLAFWRAIPHANLPQGSERSWEEGQVAVFTSPSWDLLVEDGWKPLGKPVHTFSDVHTLDPDTPLKVLHLIGTPTSTSSGKFIQAQRADFTTQQQIRQEFSAASKFVKTGQRVGSRTFRTGSDSSYIIGDATSRSSQAGMAALSLEQVPVARTTMIVVQGDPAEMFSRVRNDRENMSQLRQLGADLFASGAPIVLVLPALPADLAKIVLQQLARELAQLREPDANGLALAVARIQKTMVYWSPRPNTASYADFQKIDPDERMNTRLEQAFDITLFVAQEFETSQETLMKDLIGGYNEQSTNQPE